MSEQHVVAGKRQQERMCQGAYYTMREGTSSRPLLASGLSLSWLFKLVTYVRWCFPQCTSNVSCKRMTEDVSPARSAKLTVILVTSKHGKSAYWSGKSLP